jgi:hypothetical protein
LQLLLAIILEFQVELQEHLFTFQSVFVHCFHSFKKQKILFWVERIIFNGFLNFSVLGLILKTLKLVEDFLTGFGFEFVFKVLSHGFVLFFGPFFLFCSFQPLGFDLLDFLFSCFEIFFSISIQWLSEWNFPHVKFLFNRICKVPTQTIGSV